jgi:CheY-like chemotaxis protein
MNLMQNAVEAIGDQQGMIGISTGTMRADSTYLATTLGHEGLPAGRYAYLVVSDTGCGMTAEVCERAFEPYFAAREGRSGLGLAAVMGVVRRHGGAIKLDSREGEGTTVRVLLPLAETAAEPVAPTRSPKTQPMSRSGMTVLVADDEPSVRSAVRKILEQAGHHVLEAEDGRAAVAMFRKHAGEIAVMIVDYDMPGLSGEEVVREIRRSPESPRILVSSGHAPDSVLHRFPTGSIDGFLPKPWGPVGLISKLHELSNDAMS